jgi:hypothetical protein
MDSVVPTPPIASPPKYHFGLTEMRPASPSFPWGRTSKKARTHTTGTLVLDLSTPMGEPPRPTGVQLAVREGRGQDGVSQPAPRRAYQPSGCPALAGSVLDALVGMSDRQVAEVLRHRGEVCMADDPVPQSSRLDKAKAGLQAWTRSLKAMQASGQTAFKTSSAASGSRLQRFAMCCIADYAPAGKRRGQPKDLVYICVLWMPLTRGGHAEITWEEMSGLMSSIGPHGLQYLMEEIEFLFSIRESNTVSGTLMGFDTPWTPIEDRSADHNYGHDLSGLYR